MIIVSRVFAFLIVVVVAIGAGGAHAVLLSETGLGGEAFELAGYHRAAEAGESERGIFVLTVGMSEEFCDHTSLQDAINVSPNGGIIRVANDGFYTGSTYQIPGISLEIEGGYLTCNSPAPTSRTVLDADGNGRVFDISNTTGQYRKVTLRNFEITGGNVGSSGGGGLRIQGPPGQLTVVLDNVQIYGNTTTGIGGGIYLVPTADEDLSAGSPTLLETRFDANPENTWVHSNHAQYGGGIGCKTAFESELMPVLRFGSGQIGFNTADTHGGGIYAAGCSLRLYMANAQALAGITANQAGESGGGIYLHDDAFLIAIGGEGFGYGAPGYSMNIQGNQALRGGGIAIDGARAQLLDTRMAFNVVSQSDPTSGDSGNGGAIWVQNGAELTVNRYSGNPQTACGPAAGFESFLLCSRIEQNGAERMAAAIYHVNSSNVLIDQTYLIDNFLAPTSGSVSNSALLARVGISSSLRIRNSLMAGNEMSRRLIAVENTGSYFELKWSTIAGNPDLDTVIAGPSTSNTEMWLAGNIIWQPGTSLLSVHPNDQGDREARCNIFHQAANETDLTLSLFQSVIDPQFIDPDQGDFRLAANSPAIDYCDGANANSGERDLDLSLRGEAYPDERPPAPGAVPGGLYDLGAFERYLDRLFRDRFEN